MNTQKQQQNDTRQQHVFSIKTQLTQFKQQQNCNEQIILRQQNATIQKIILQQQQNEYAQQVQLLINQGFIPPYEYNAIQTEILAKQQQILTLNGETNHEKWHQVFQLLLDKLKIIHLDCA